MQNITKNKFLEMASKIAKGLDERIEPNFEAFLGFIYEHPGVANKKGKVELGTYSSKDDVEQFLQAYLKQNFKARKKKIVLKKVSTVADPAVDVVLETFGRHEKVNMRMMMEYHRASMAAENKVGELLEAYLASKLEPLGWFWCSCSILRGVDFFKPGNPVQLLQVKNRSNSENSSSAKIRETLKEKGCPVKIGKWYRTESSTGNTCWLDFEGNASGKLFTEEGFYEFIRTYNIS